MPDTQIDGHEIEQWQGRFTKTFDIDRDNLEQMRLDKVVLWVVATRAGDSNFKVLDSGEVRKVTVYKVEDAAPLSGELRDQAMTFLAHGPGHGHFALAPEGFTLDTTTGEVPNDGTLVCEEHGRYFAEEGCEGCTQAFEDSLAAQRVDTQGEPPRDESDSATDVAEAPSEAAGGPEVVGRLDEYKDGAVPERSGGSGPKVAKFNPDEMEPDGAIPVGDREFIGSVYPDGHKGRDKVLQRAMEAPEL
jgi:hypothetical protein